MTSSVIPTFNKNYYTVTQQHQDRPSPYCTLQWRRGQLLVKSPRDLQQPSLAALNTEQSLVNCLKSSPVNLVRIDPKLGEAKLRLWADACLQAKKPIFLHIPSANKQLKPGSSPLWWLKQLINWIAALVFLPVVSPVMLGLILLIRIYSPGSPFSREWHIGERGKLFQMIKFRTTVAEGKQHQIEVVKYHNRLCDSADDKYTTLLGRWICKSGLDNLPQLFNVIRGEMSLVGPRCYTLEEAVRLTLDEQQQINTLPGIINLAQVKAESTRLDLDSQAL